MRLSAIISDGMIFQRDKEFKIFGTAKPGEIITAQMGEKNAEGRVNEDGFFLISFSAFAAGGPYELTLKDATGKTVTCKDMWAGDVFLLSGQSNMELPVKRTLDLYREEAERTDEPRIRMFQLPKEPLFGVQRTLLEEGEWIAADARTVMNFSAVGFFFAKYKQAEDGVAVGLVHAAIGGAHIEAFISEETLLKEMVRMRTEAVRRGELCRCNCDKNGSCKWCYDKLLSRNKDAEYVKSVLKSEDDMVNAWFEKRDRHDIGLKAQWQSYEWPAAELAEAVAVTLPGLWHGNKLGKMFGTVWLQRTIEVPDHFTEKEVELRLGTLVDSDVTYINGIEVGRTEYRYPPRRYPLAPGLLKEGRNVITIRLTMDANVGGAQPDMPYCIKCGEDELPLNGQWYVRIGTVEDALESRTFFCWQPTALYNSMIYPVKELRFAGILFYQGESNCEHAEDYVYLHRAMIEEWRSLFGEELPYVYAQLPDFAGEGEGGRDAWIRMQHAQAKTLELRGTRMAILHDLGEYNEIHPQNKKEVAERFYAQWCSFKDIEPYIHKSKEMEEEY